MLFVESITGKDLKVYLPYGQKVSGNKREQLANQLLAMNNNTTIVDNGELEGHDNDDDEEEGEEHEEEQTSNTL
jgi:hypothetical protein